jgi:VWFA-related protein
MRATARKAFLSAGMLFVSMALALGQSQKQAADADQAVKLSTELVTLEADVLSKKTGQAIKGLRKEDFVIYEDGVAQEITNFSQDKLPISVLVLIDVSGSVWPQIKKLRQGTFESLQTLKPEDEVAVMIFAARPKLTLNFTKDKSLAIRAIEMASAEDVGSETNSNEAVFQAAAYMKNATNPDNRRVIIAISDDVTTHKVLLSSKARTSHELLESGSVVCGLLYDSIYKSKPEPQTDPYGAVMQTVVIAGETDLIKSFIDRTGGVAIRAKKENVKEGLTQIVDRLRARYSFAYVSSNNNRDGKFRRIRLRVSPEVEKREKGISIVTRKGYNARKGESLN